MEKERVKSEEPDKKNKEVLMEKRKEKEDAKVLISKLYNKICENPYYLHFVCPFCFKNRNGDYIFEEKGLYVNKDGLEKDSSDAYRRNLIEGIKNKSITKMIRYINPKKCEHFYHSECADKFNQEKKYKFKCYCCEKYITPNNIKVICDLGEKEYNNAIYKKLSF